MLRGGGEQGIFILQSLQIGPTYASVYKKNFNMAVFALSLYRSTSILSSVSLQKLLPLI